MKYAILGALCAVVAACTTPQEAIRQAHHFCGMVAEETGNKLADYPEYAMGCTERGARGTLAQQRGTVTGVATGLAITAAGVKLAQ